MDTQSLWLKILGDLQVFYHFVLLGASDPEVGKRLERPMILL
jgi:hypothetical protein